MRDRLSHFFAHPEFCAAGAGISLQFLIRRYDGLTGNDLHLRLLTANANRKTGRAGAALGSACHGSFDDPVFQGMEGDHRQPAPVIQAGNGILHDLFHTAQLVIDSNADGLKAALGRMLLFTQCLRGHGTANHIHQLQRGFDGLFLPLLADSRSDFGCVTLFIPFLSFIELIFA